MEDVLIILTSTVFVQNKCYLFQTDPCERLNLYLKSVNQWLQTNFKIIVVENSGYEFRELHDKINERFEIITFNENELPEASYLKENNSKGSSELFSINYALNKTKMKYRFVIKITGRYFIPNFEEYLSKINLFNYDGLSQHNPARCEIVGCSFSKKEMVFNKDSEHNHVEFVYQQRINQLNKVLQMKELKIEQTQIGGLNEIRHYL